MSVRQNIGYGLKAAPDAEGARSRGGSTRSRDCSGSTDLLERRPSQLSGGQRQRVAMGRAIAREPQAFLLDEPLSNLDAKLRVGMRASLAQLHHRLGITTVYVTHDQVEAMTLGQRVAVMRDGRILQVDTPHRSTREPRNLFVAGFIGSPAMNLVEATVEAGVVGSASYSVPLARRPRRARRPGHPRDPAGELRGRGVRARAADDRRRRRGARGSRLRRARLLHRRRARRSRPRCSRPATRTRCSLDGDGAASRRASTRARGARVAQRARAGGRPGAAPLLRPADRREAAAARSRDAAPAEPCRHAS